MEPYSGLRIANRVVGRAELSAALEGRRVHRVSALATLDRSTLSEVGRSAASVMGGERVRGEGVTWALVAVL